MSVSGTFKEEEIRKREVFNRYLALVAKDIDRFFSDTRPFISIPCPACYGKDLEHQFKKTRFDYDLCRDCGTLFVNPRPRFEDLMRFYSDSESTSFFVNDFFKPVAQIRREKIFRPRVEYVAQRFSGEALQTIGDIGAGFGIFLDEFRKVCPGKRFVAIEPSQEMAAICRKDGFEVLECAAEDVKTHAASFDLLTAFELFEHLYDPKDFLLKVRGLLKPGGYFLLTTLNGQGFDIQILWENSKSVSPPHHLNFFNPRSIVRLAQSCGLEPVETATPGKLDWDIVEGMILKEGIKPGRLWEGLARYGESSAKEELQRWIAEQGL
ncbi:MAG: hypothetical protein AUJ72_01775, partial [Candidatus Omnitrophica bacterium CG1_02_46_14]